MGKFNSLYQIRQDQYALLKKRFAYIFNWSAYPYRNLKLKFYIEAGCFLAFWLLKIKMKANYVTALYGFMGIAGGVLIALPFPALICTGASFYFFRGVLDVTDGILARKLNQASVNGTIFDSYSAHLGWISLWSGLGIYLGNTTSAYFYPLAVIIPALFAADLHANAMETILVHKLVKKTSNVKKPEQRSNILSESSKLRSLKNIIDKVFAHNCRTLDLIVLALFVETITTIRIIWVYYSLYLFWLIFIFLIRFFMLVRGGWAEKEIEFIEQSFQGE